MKLLRVISSMDPKSGGPCQGIRNMQAEINRLGTEVEVVCLDNADADYLKNELLTIHALGEGKSSFAYHPKLLPWLEENILRFDAVILHGLWQWPCIAAWFAIKRLKKKHRKNSFSGETFSAKVPPYFVMPHGMLDPWFQRDRSRRFKAIRNWIVWKLVQHRVIRDAEALLFTCEEELLLARETFRPYDPKREINVGYGVPEPPPRTNEMEKAFREHCRNLPKEQPYLLFLSRIHSKKGVDLLIKAYADLFNKNNLEEDAHEKVPALVIAGPLDSDYAQSMILLAESLLPGAVFKPGSHLVDSGDSVHERRKSSIHFTGMIAGAAKWGAFYGCDAFILPSHQENFGIAVVEAMSCDKPVLISNKINIWKEIEKSKGGRVFQDNKEGVWQMLKRWIETQDQESTNFQPWKCYETHFSDMTAARNLLDTLKSYVG